MRNSCPRHLSTWIYTACGLARNHGFTIFSISPTTTASVSPVCCNVMPVIAVVYHWMARQCLANIIKPVSRSGISITMCTIGILERCTFIQDGIGLRPLPGFSVIVVTGSKPCIFSISPAWRPEHPHTIFIVVYGWALYVPSRLKTDLYFTIPGFRKIIVVGMLSTYNTFVGLMFNGYGWRCIWLPETSHKAPSGRHTM